MHGRKEALRRIVDGAESNAGHVGPERAEPRRKRDVRGIPTCADAHEAGQDRHQKRLGDAGTATALATATGLDLGMEFFRR